MPKSIYYICEVFKKVMASYTSKILTCFIFAISLYLVAIEIVSGGSLLPEETWTGPKEGQLAELIRVFSEYIYTLKDVCSA